MLLLGIDVGTSSIKASVIDSAGGACIASAQFPDTETGIISLQHGWAEQSPEMWWEHVQQAILKLNASRKCDPKDISAIGISYQMHGLVLVDQRKEVLRDAIIWCDSRAVPYGEAAFHAIGEEKCLVTLLNSPGNFTAAKLAWVKENEPHIYEQIDKVLLPGDYIAMKFTGAVTTTISALSEGIFWDFTKDELSADVLNYFGFECGHFPAVHPVFSEHGLLRTDVAENLGLKPGIPVSYKAGDQPNNALSLNVLKAGEVAATAGTSGVIYAVTDQLAHDRASRVNGFAHVNYTPQDKHIGILLCINGVGILNRWIKNTTGSGTSYARMNEDAMKVPAGSDGVRILPFGNGAERMLENRDTGAQIHGVDLNTHTAAHLWRAAQEAIAFSFRYGMDILRENKISPAVIRAGRANMFLSPLFAQTFVNATQVPVELYNCDGSVGAAIGAGLGAGLYRGTEEAFSGASPLQLVEPDNRSFYDERYQEWKELLNNSLGNQ